jgi:hypothetical protein
MLQLRAGKIFLLSHEIVKKEKNEQKSRKKSTSRNSRILFGETGLSKH